MAGRTVITDPITAHPLTAIRATRGWTLQDVARIVERRAHIRIGNRADRVWRWEHGTTPNREAQHAIADELGIDRQHLATHPWPQWLLLTDMSEPVDAEWTPRVAGELLARVVDSAGMDRRGFLILSRQAAAALAAAWTTAPAGVFDHGGNRVTPDVVAALTGRVEHLWHLDDLLGGAAVLDAGRADLQFAHNLLTTRSYDQTTGQNLWSLVASLARFCGWAAFDGGLLAAGQRYQHAALRAAAAAGDTSDGVYALSNMALQSVYGGDPRTALDLIDAARTRTDPSWRIVHAMLDTWAARAHAAAGEPADAVTALGRADDHYGHRTDGADPGWVYWMPQPRHTAEAGTALLHAGRPADAHTALTIGIAGLPGDADRDRRLYLSRIAETHLATGDAEAAAAALTTAVDTLTPDDRGRVPDDLARVVQLLPRTRTADDVRELHRTRTTAA